MQSARPLTHDLLKDVITALGRKLEAVHITELRDDMHDVDPVDLALVPIGGWGPTLDDGHMHPEHGAEAVARVGARWAVPVHWGTFWPQGLRRVARANHHRLFVTPGDRFAAALAGSPTEAVLAVPGHRVEL